MWKKRNLLLVLLVFAIIFGGCGKKEADNQQKFQADYIELSPAGSKVEEGYFCVIQGVSYFIDFETKTAVPICNKPDCRHLSEYEDRDTTCSAVNGNYYTFPYQGKMYGINVGENGSELTISELDGSNLKVKGEFETGNSMMDEGVIVGNQMFYSYTETLDIVGTGETMIPEYGCCFAVLNLDTMECEKIFS